MENNICKFLPNGGELKSINILNFVLEKEKQVFTTMRVESVYKTHFVLNGTGKLHCTDNTCEIKSGDVFFTFPSSQYAIESGEDFEYMYISYVGVRANELTDRLGITRKNFIFTGLEELKPLWEKSIMDNKSVLDLRCEGLLLYTFSILGEKIEDKKNAEKNDEIILMMKKYIDENFSNVNLSLDMISKKYSYNKKYISGLFKKRFKVGISQYIKTLRLQKACTLMEQGFTSVKDISAQCGFSDPFYFSRVFKERRGTSPKEHIAQLNNKQ